MPARRQTPFEVIPAVDVLDGKVVRLRRGDYGQVTEYGSDPVDVARAWLDQGAGRVHVVDLAGARSGETNFDLWERMAAAGVVFQAGGGIRTAQQARAVLAMGADRVVMGTAAVWQPSALEGLGKRVLAAVDVRGDKATGAGWLDDGRDVDDVLDSLAGVGVEQLLVTGISRDGMLDGPDIELTEQVVADRRFGVIASGGVGGLDDVDRLSDLGCEAVVVGRALYEGHFTLADALGRLR
jgi:phosphoribosylformimino-5-aminoimidazole carboxamide ribotide isomerase